MEPQELKQYINVKFNGVQNFHYKIMQDPNVINKPSKSELNGIITSGIPKHQYEAIRQMAKHYRKTVVKRTLTKELAEKIRFEIYKQFGSIAKFCDIYDLENAFVSRVVNGTNSTLTDRVKKLCGILGVDVQ